MKDFNLTKILAEARDYLTITFGIALYAFGWGAFMLPYQITTGGVAGIGAIVWYATGTIPIQTTYFLINAAFLAIALKVLGLKFMIKTIYGILCMTFMLWFFQRMMTDSNGEMMQIIGANQDFMACILGASLCGIGLGTVFLSNGSTGGTDIIAAVINKYRDITLGRVIMYCDIVIIASCYFIFYDWRRVVFGFCTLLVTSFVLDYIMNSMRQSVQFLIISNKYEEIANAINNEAQRGCTMLDGEGGFSKINTKVIIVLARKNESNHIFSIIKNIDENAFISQSSVIGVFGNGFDTIKVNNKKIKK